MPEPFDYGNYPVAEWPEVRAAARWWASHVRKAREIADANDIFGRESSTLALIKHLQIPLEDFLLNEFEHALRHAIADLPGFYGAHWDPARPEWAGVWRAIHCGDHSNATLLQACNAVGYRNLIQLLPYQAHCWINPGVVRIALDRGGLVTIFPETPTNQG